MELSARYHDGLVAFVRNVICRVEGEALVISDLETRTELDRWNAADVYPLHARRHELRIGATSKPAGARLAFNGYEPAKAAHAMLPALDHRNKLERGRQYRTVALATAALVSVVAAWIYGIPLLAKSIVPLVPSDWEARLGETVVEQIEAQLASDPAAGFEVCDTNPDSLANRAIARFAAQVVDGTGSPFVPDIKVIRTTIPNAFALPGGHSYYFSALLTQTNSADEFAGVMAHELGHVVHRHSMEKLISTSATGLLIGFILGDMTGLSVAGGLGVQLINNSFSRESEREADRFAADTARKMSFQPAALADLLERVSGDDEMSKAMALLSTHPLTAERRAYLQSLTVEDPTLSPPFTEAEWQAIRTICDPRPTSPPAPPSAPASTPPPVNG
jgi:Zn-dependent protease with chaperone function